MPDFKFCPFCGGKISYDADFCNSCGRQVTNGQQINNNNMSMQNNIQPTTPTNDNGGFGWGVLGCCVPIAGLILWLVWKDEKPKTAKAAGIGALVAVIVTVVFYVLYFILILIGIAVSAS